MATRCLGDAPPPPITETPDERPEGERSEAPLKGSVLRCDDLARSSRTDPIDDGGFAPKPPPRAISPWLGISAPRPPPGHMHKSVVRRYRARAAPGAELPAEVAAALDAGDPDYDSCLKDAGDDRLIKLTIDVGPSGKIVSVDAKEESPDPVERCLMEQTCTLRGAPSQAAATAVIPLFIKQLVALGRGGAAADLPAVSIVSAKFGGPRREQIDGEAQQAVTDATISLMTQAAAVCRRDRLAAPGVHATFAVGFDPHSTVRPTLRFGAVELGDPAPPDASIQCVMEALSGTRMPGMWYSGALKVRVTWDP